MRRAYVLILVIVAALGGCTHTVALGRPATADEYRAVSRALAAEDAEVLTRYGRRYPLFNVELSSDSLFGVYRNGYGTQAISMADVLEIRGGKDRGGGALRGLKIGALIGAGMGLLSSFSSEAPCRVEPCPGSSAYVIQMAAGGAVWGVTIGAIRGNRIQYVITP